MKLTLSVIACSVVFAAAASAQAPTVAAVLNAASYGQPGMPNEGVAQGSIATAFGTNLGPVEGNYQGTLPLPKTWAGVSVQITVGGTTVDAYPIQLFGTQISFVVPSNTPVGTGTVTVTVNGTSGTGPIKVVANNLGIFSNNFSGEGPGVVDDAQNRRIRVTQSARPGDVVVIWGTGIGAVAGAPDNVTSGNLANVPVEVYIGGQPAAIQYRGRTSCCVGLDQINAVVPQNVSGCAVPVVVKAGDIVSNTVTIAVAPNGGTCSNEGSPLNSAFLNAAQQRGTVSTGSVSLMRMNLYEPTSQMTITQDSGSASFYRYTWDQFQGDIDSYGLQQYGSCIVDTFRSGDGGGGNIEWVGLDAGAAISVTGPGGTKSLPAMQGVTGTYYASLGGGFPIPGVPATDPWLVGGQYTVTGPGGANVGTFNKVFNVPNPLTWTNMTATDTVNRAQGVTVNWTGGDPNGYVMISGSQTSAAANDAGASFTCWARVNAGTFTVPSVVLLALPPTPVGDENSGSLQVGSWSDAGTFQATGIDLGTVGSMAWSARGVNYQ